MKASICLMLGASMAVASASQCFCPDSPMHCSQDNDRSCVLPVDQNGVACTDPLDQTGCECSAGTTSCVDKKYTLTLGNQPGLASPKNAFGIQPQVRLLVNGEVDTSDSDTWVRVSIANVQSSESSCSGNTPCKHNNVGDNTCFAMQEQFPDSGVYACPAGTTEVLPEQSNVQLYRFDRNDPDVGKFDKECRNSEELQETSREHLTNFCSDEVPCKQINDGTCMPKVSFNPAAAGFKEPTKSSTVEICRAQDQWRTAVPSKSEGWFFETDPSCDLTNAKNGCKVDGQYYAMDKWCEHNCHPVTGQEPFCPESHCACEPEKVKVEPDQLADWRCPLEKYGSAECRCSAGTEQCGSIMVKLDRGVANFEHLTIGTPGKYVLRFEVVNPEPLTNRAQIEAQSAMFAVTTPLRTGTYCRAQEFWRRDNLNESEEHGAGEAWFYEDSNAVEVGADGTVRRERVYAMDTWCRANFCAEHTLESHCELVDRSGPVEPVCESGQVDSFGDCCVSGQVDGCGVCNGDGSTCMLFKYLDTFAPEGRSSEETEAIFAEHRCADLAAPCLHLNDGTCVQKTMNSESKLTVDHHCYFDRSNTADTLYWKFGDWNSAKGRESLARGTLESAKNTDCFCPAGSVDTSPKLLAELMCIHTTEEAELLEADERKLFFYENQAVMVYDQACPDGAAPANAQSKKLEHAGPEGHSMCGQHFDGSGGEGSCWSGDDCLNDRIRCIRLGALTTATLYKHCNSVEDSIQVEYAMLDNSDKTEPTYFNLDPAYYDMSRIVTRGSGGALPTKCSVLGTLFNCLERDAAQVAELCRKNKECAAVMGLLETCMASGETLPACIMEQRSNSQLYADLTNAFANSECLAGNVMATSLRSLSESAVHVMLGAQVPAYAQSPTASITSTSSGPALLRNNNDLPQSKKGAGGLSAGALGGIIAGVAGVGILGAVAVTHIKRTRAKNGMKNMEMPEL